MKTVSTLMSRSDWPAVRPMYFRARSAVDASSASAMAAGSGTEADSGSAWPGLVPQVT